MASWNCIGIIILAVIAFFIFRVFTRDSEDE